MINIHKTINLNIVSKVDYQLDKKYQLIIAPKEFVYITCYKLSGSIIPRDVYLNNI